MKTNSTLYVLAFIATAASAACAVEMEESEDIATAEDAVETFTVECATTEELFSNDTDDKECLYVTVADNCTGGPGQSPSQLTVKDAGGDVTKEIDMKKNSYSGKIQVPADGSLELKCNGTAASTDGCCTVTQSANDLFCSDGSTGSTGSGASGSTGSGASGGTGGTGGTGGGSTTGAGGN